MRNTRNKRSEAKSKNEKYEQKNNVKKLTKNRYLSSYHILFCFFLCLLHPPVGFRSSTKCTVCCGAMLSGSVRLRSSGLRTQKTAIVQVMRLPMQNGLHFKINDKHVCLFDWPKKPKKIIKTNKTDEAKISKSWRHDKETGFVVRMCTCSVCLRLYRAFGPVYVSI